MQLWPRFLGSAQGIRGAEGLLGPHLLALSEWREAGQRLKGRAQQQGGAPLAEGVCVCVPAPLSSVLRPYPTRPCQPLGPTWCPVLSHGLDGCVRSWRAWLYLTVTTSSSLGLVGEENGSKLLLSHLLSGLSGSQPFVWACPSCRLHSCPLV